METLLPNSPQSPIPEFFIESPTSPFPKELDISTSENFQFSELEDTKETEVTAELFHSNYDTAPGTPYFKHTFGGYHIESTLFIDHQQEESIRSSDKLLPDTATAINFDIKDKSFEQSISFEPLTKVSISYFPLFPILPPGNLNQQPAPTAQSGAQQLAQPPVQPPV